jgi:hypothetical protein
VTQEPSTSTESAPQTGKVLDHIETYKLIAEWIRFADAKAGVTLTVNGVLLGLLVPTLKTYFTDKSAQFAAHGTGPAGWWFGVVVVLFIGWLALLVASAVSSFLCILPLRGRQRSLILEKAAHFHPAAVATHYSVEEPQRFIEDCEKAGLEGLNREVLAAILLDAHLSNAKYRYVTRSIRSLAASVLFGFLYLLAIQV